MNDEKVIKGLEHCTSHERDSDKFGGIGKCRGCPYYGYDCVDRLKNDALALIKNHEKLSLLNLDGELVDGQMLAICPHCHKIVSWDIMSLR